MLKIKNHISSKKLNKFGFFYDAGYDQYLHYIDDRTIYAVVYSPNRELNFITRTNGMRQSRQLLDLIYDLIQAGLVEKVVQDVKD